MSTRPLFFNKVHVLESEALWPKSGCTLSLVAPFKTMQHELLTGSSLL